MSHTTSIDNIVFSDVDALKAAVNELVSKGVKCALERNSSARAFYTNQEGMSGVHPYVLRLHDCPYDVAFVQDTKKKGLVARTDLFADRVAGVLGTPKAIGESKEQAALGKLYQSYAIHAATRKAVQQGMSVKRVNAADGSVKLVVTGIR